MANDKIHDAVINALTKEDWFIIKEHFKIEYEEIEVYADLLAERSPIIAEKARQRIIVEVKTFAGRSFVKELQQALGQYDLYVELIELAGLEYELYLAISEFVYERFFLRPATNRIVVRRQVKFLVVNIEREEVVKWVH